MRGAAIVAIVAVVAIAAALPVAAETVIVRSGNAPTGSSDPITVVTGPDRALPLHQAAVLASSPGWGWAQAPPGCKWVSTNSSGIDAGGIYDYLVSFELPAGFADASITVTWGGDDGAWLFLNQTNLGLSVSSLATATCSDQSCFVAGENTLDFAVDNARIGSNPTGLCYSATVTYTASVPEPPSTIVLLCGIGAVVSGIIRRRRV